MNKTDKEYGLFTYYENRIKFLEKVIGSLSIVAGLLFVGIVILFILTKTN